MRTLDQRGRARLVSDVRLAFRIAAMIVGYWSLGARLRRAYRAAEASGGTLWLDGAPIHHREAPLRR